jgi:CheY-like chemotaxis protein
MDLINKKLTVLLADDDPDEHSKFIRAITDASSTVKIESAYNGMQLLEHLLKYSQHKSKDLPDLIITDLYMPFAGGLQVLKQIRMHPQFKGIPIYVFSKNHDNTIRAKVIENGASEFHRKPSDFNELSDLINHILVKTSLKKVA